MIDQFSPWVRYFILAPLFVGGFVVLIAWMIQLAAAFEAAIVARDDRPKP